MDNQKHIIRRQTINIEMAESENSIAVRDTIKQVYYDKIIPRLDALFSDLVTNETIIRIDKLEVDLGGINKNTLEQQLIEKAVSGIEKQLKEKLQFDVKAGDDINILSANQSAIDEFIYFLTHGYFSWRNHNNEVRLLEKALIDGKMAAADLTNKLDKLLKENPLVTDRLIYQFSDNFLNFLSQQYLPGFLAKVSLETIQKSIIGIPSAKTDARNYFWKTLFTNRFLPANDLKLKVIVATCRFVASKQNISLATVMHSMDKSGLPSEILDELEDILIKESFDGNSTSAASSFEKGKVDDEKNAPYDGRPSSEDVTVSETNMPTQKERLQSEKAGKENADKRSKNKDKTLDSLTKKEKKFGDNKNEQPSLIGKKETINPVGMDEPIYIELAGLVILHNFLVIFFEALHLTRNKIFINEEALCKAVHLAGYLATGEIFLEEHYLILPKLLCGMDLAQLIQKDIVLNEDEIKEADDLLKQVIEHWPALKNTSTGGLRNAFLKREGKLTRGGLGWQLDVEHKTWDILLAKLPWGYSLIKLPWMKELLFVNWS